MEIIKTNGKPASRKTHQLAEAVIETALYSSLMLTKNMKRKILLSIENTPWDLDELKVLTDEELNRTIAVYFALNSWYIGCYVRYDLDFDSLEKFFYYWD